MPPQLKENFLGDYPELGKFDLKALNPAFEETMFDLAKQVPEYGFWEDEYIEPFAGKKPETLITPATRRAIDQVLGLFLHKEGGKLEAYSNKGIRNHIAAFIISVRARIWQMSPNQRWIDNMYGRLQAEDERVENHRRLIAAGQENVWYPNITHQPVQSCTKQQFEASPNNHAKRVQRIMTNETDRLIIPDEKEAFTPEAIGSLIIDPYGLTDRQVEGLGISLPWTGKKRTSRLEKIEYFSTLPPRLKTELSALNPIGKGDPHDKFGRWRLYGNVEGNVLSTTTSSGKDSYNVARLKDAIRAREHTRTGSLSETGKIAGVIRRILDVDKQLQKGKWEQVKDNEKLAEAKNTLFQAFDALKNVRNPDKKEARDLLEKAMTLETTYTRVIKRNGKPPETIVTVKLNPGAKRSQLEKALRKLKTRKAHSLPRISRYTANDRQILEEELAEHQNIPFNQLEAYLDRHFRGSSPLDHKKMSPAQREGVVSRLNEWLERFVEFPAERKAWLEPYRSFVDLIQEDLNQAIETVDNEETAVSDLKTDLAELKISLRLKKFWESWEQLYDQHLTQKKLPTFVYMIRDLVLLKKEINDIPTTSRSGFIFETYLTKIDEMTALCREAFDNWHEPDGKKKAKVIHQQLKVKAREADIVALLKKKKEFEYEEKQLDDMFGPPSADEDGYLGELGEDGFDD